LWRSAGAGGEGKDAKQDRQRFHDGSPAC
jgi:hypothetical protein